MKKLNEVLPTTCNSLNQTDNTHSKSSHGSTGKDGKMTTQSQLPSLALDQIINPTQLPTSLPQPLESLLDDNSKAWSNFINDDDRELKQEALPPLQNELQRLNQLLAPACDSLILKKITMLRSRYHSVKGVLPSVQEALIEEDLHHAKRYPAWLFIEAYDAWVNNADNRFTPSTIAQMVGDLDWKMVDLQKRKKRIEFLLNKKKANNG